jgi:outer membrane lipoprotein-sorting protein
MAISDAGTVRIARAWAAPVGAVALVLVGAVALGGLHPSNAFAAQHPSLPAKTPAQLLTAVQESGTQALSGTVTETAHWGLPSLPGGTDSASLNWQGLLTGSHTLRVVAAGPDRQRVAVLGSLSESDVVHNGTDVWTYTSATNSVTHSTLPSQGKEKAGTTDPTKSLTPQGATQQLLDAIQPSTNVSVGTTERVAGRSAYTLVLSPRDTRSTVRKVTIALDSQHFVPLRVALYGAGVKPAFQTSFTSISFATPAASTFTFRPPAGSTSASDPFGFDGHHSSAAVAGGRAEATGKITTFGKGWTTVVELPASTGLPQATGKDRRSGSSPSALLNDVTSPLGQTGYRVLRTSVVNALITPDGRIFAGAVSIGLLQSAAAGTYK